MTEIYYKQKLLTPPYVPTRLEFSRHYGGIINIRDFNTDYRGFDTKSSYVADNIAKGMRFDDVCCRNIEARERGRLNGKQQ